MSLRYPRTKARADVAALRSGLIGHAQAVEPDTSRGLADARERLRIMFQMETSFLRFVDTF